MHKIQFAKIQTIFGLNKNNFLRSEKPDIERDYPEILMLIKRKVIFNIFYTLLFENQLYLCIVNQLYRMLLIINNELSGCIAGFCDAGNVPPMCNEAVTFHEALRAP